MNASLDVIVRSTIPIEMQAELCMSEYPAVFHDSCRISSWRGMVDQVCEPFMAGTGADSLAAILFGQGKGSGAAMMIFLLGLTGMTVCLVFGKVLKKYRYQER